MGFGRCFKFGELGHRKVGCPQEKRTNIRPQGYQGYQEHAQHRRYLGDSQTGKTQFQGRPTMQGKPPAQLKGEASDVKGQPVKARVFAITPQEAKDSEEVVTCILLIANKFGRVLFDSDASHSFISEEFCLDLSVEIACFIPALRVMMPTGG